MWMVDCNNDHGKESKIFSDSIFSRRLRPLMPRPLSSNNTANATFSCSLTTPPSCFCGTSKPNTLLPWNHTMMSGLMSDNYGIRREMNSAMPLVSTRWNPTPEQLQLLEEMYKRGTRTPTAEQIQQIASKLRRFGKIEGKNVFYWFQNHKARERQKIKRRQLELLGGKKSTRNAEENTKETAGLSSRCNDFEHQNKNLPTLSTCSNKSYTKATVSMHGSVMTERENKDEWTQLDQKELHQNQKMIDDDNYNNDNKVTAKSVNNYCLKLDLSSSSFLPANKNTFTAAAAAHEKKAPSGQHQNCSKLFGSMLILSPTNDDSIINVEENIDQTLQLFPVGSSVLNNSVELCDHVSDMGRKFASAEFIEFLPTKN